MNNRIASITGAVAVACAVILTSGASGQCEPAWIPTFIDPGVDSQINALTMFDDGSGPALYAGGDFTTAGGVTVNRIAKWDGTAWSALGSGMSGGASPWVYALKVFDDGSGGGPALYAGGRFTTAGGVTVSYIAKWDGTAWLALGSGISSTVYALTVFDDGSGAGPALYAGGSFTTAGGVTVNRIAKWDGAAWSALGSGMSGFDPWVYALTVFDDGSGPALYAGGRFTTAGGVSASHIAKWQGCPPAPPCYADCDGSGTLNIDDFLCFQLKFALQEPYADCDGNSVFNIDDFLCFQLAFALGCE